MTRPSTAGPGAEREQAEPKKAYAKPRLAVLGDLQALTRDKPGDHNDGGGKPSTRLKRSGDAA